MAFLLFLEMAPEGSLPVGRFSKNFCPKEQHIKSSTESDDGKCLKPWATFVDDDNDDDNDDNDGHDFFLG